MTDKPRPAAGTHLRRLMRQQHALLQISRVLA